MDITTIKEKLSEEEFTSLSTHIKTLTEQRDFAKTESITNRKTQKAEIDALRTLKNKLFDKLGLADDADIDALELPTKEAGVEQAKKYERQIKQLTDTLNATKEQFTTLEKTHRTTVLEAQLSKSLGSHQFIDNELVSEYVKSRLQFEDGTISYKEGDKLLSLDEGIRLLATTKPHLVKAQGTGGSGFNPKGSTGKGKDFKTMTLDERGDLYKQSPAEYKALKEAAGL